MWRKAQMSHQKLRTPKILSGPTTVICIREVYSGTRVPYLMGTTMRCVLHLHSKTLDLSGSRIACVPTVTKVTASWLRVRRHAYAPQGELCWLRHLYERHPPKDIQRPQLQSGDGMRVE